MFFRKKSFYKKNKKFLIMAGLILVIAVLGFRDFKGKNNEEKSTENNNQSVILISLNEYIQNQAIVKGTGEVEAIAQVELKSEVSAVVRDVLVSIGDIVVPGQPLVYFKNGELASQYNQAKADLDRMIATKDQLEAQYQMTIVSHSRTESNSASAITTAQAAYDLAENNLKLNSSENSSQIVQDAYDDVVPTIKTLHSTLRNSFLSTDTILGLDTKSANDAFENKISLNDISALNLSTTQYNRVKLKVDNIYELITNLSVVSSQEDVDSAIEGLENAFIGMDLLWSNLDIVLTNTLGAEQSIFDSLKTIVDGGKSDMVTISTGIINLKQGLGGAKSSLTGVEIAYNKAVEDLKETKVRVQADIASYLAQLDQSEATLRSQDASVARAKAVLSGIGATLSKTTIKSPIAGTIAVLPAKVGELITPGSLIASVVNTNGLRIRAFVDSGDINKVSVNASVIISGNVNGAVTNVAPSIDPKTRKVEVLIAVSEPELSKFVVGQFVDIEIEEIQLEEENSVIRLPLKSIDVTNSGSFVYVLGEENIVEKREVVLSRVIGSDVEVISGLDNIETIIKSVRGVKIGEKVDIKN